MMDATQMICDSILESDEDNQDENDKGDPLGKLCILKNPHIAAKECPLFLGDNVLGRDPNICSLPLPAPSVSKQHATISLSVFKRKGGKDEVEALLWDVGSMNGTRKGYLKLTPNVRYALSDGDSIVVADLPCKFMKCAAEADARTSVTNSQCTKVSGALRGHGSNLNMGKTKSLPGTTKAKDSTADPEVTEGTPARWSGLAVAQTPMQEQQCCLVPDSGSESDEEKSKTGDRKRQAIVSDSDSHKSSPTCSTFLSPTYKVVPESEDESPITPSSSHKNRTQRVSFTAEGGDAYIHRQEQKRTVALEIVDDSDDETGNDEAAMANKSSLQPEQAKVVESNGCSEARVPSQFNLESDTDEEEMLTTAAPRTLSNNVQTPSAPEFHMDSDTDVEDEENKPSSSSSSVPKDSQVPPVVQPQSISLDSDTDVEEEGERPTIAAPLVTLNIAPVNSNHALSSKAPELNMDSDTDVEDEDLLSNASAKPVGQLGANPAAASKPANPNEFNLDSDTEVEEGEADLNGDAVDTESRETPSRSDAKSDLAAPPGVCHDKGIPDLEILSNSDTDLEDDSQEIQPSVFEAKEAEGQISNAGTNAKVSVVEQGKGEDAATGDSDTDAEEGVVKEKRDTEVPFLQRELTPEIQGPLQENCSSPIQQPEGNMEELETQPFLSPSISAYRLAVAARKGSSLASSLDCQDLVVAETQSFILDDRGRDTLLEENPSISDRESSMSERDRSDTSGGRLQLDLSDSVLQAQALAMESTQDFVHINLEETQAYADDITSGKQEGPVDIAQQATQAYIAELSSDEESEGQTTDEASQEVDQSVPQSAQKRDSEEELDEATQPIDFMSAATQPMCLDDGGDSKDSASDFGQKNSKQIEAEGTQQPTSSTVASAQPMETMEDGASSDGAPALRKKRAKRVEEEETQPLSDVTVAQTQPMEIMDDAASDEDSPVLGTSKQLDKDATAAEEIPKDGDSDEEDSVQSFRKRKAKYLEPMEDTEPFEEFIVAPTQPIPTTETEDCGAADSPKVVRKVGTRKQKEEALADSDLAVAPTQPVAPSEDVASDEDNEGFLTPRKRKARKLEDTQSLTNSQEDAEEEQSRDEAGSISVRLRRGARSEQQETSEKVSAKAQERQARGKRTSAPVSKGRRGRAKALQEDESDTEETPAVDKDAEEAQRKQQDEERAARLQKGEEEQKREQEGRERPQRKRREELKRERIEKERAEKEREKEELAANCQKEKEEKERREEIERKAKEQREKLEKERIDKEKEESAINRKKDEEKRKKEREERKRLKAEEELRKREQERAPRGRRKAPRRTTGAPDEDQGPATRTRSRSNSSDSVSSERSLSSLGSQTNHGRGGRGRGGGARKTEEVRAEKTPARGRRRTVASAEMPVPSAPATLSRSSSEISLSSEVSVSSASSQARGRGGRQPGRGRRPESEDASNQASSQKAPQRRSMRFCPEEKQARADKPEPSVSTRGQGGARDQAIRRSAGHEASAEEPTASRRGGRKRLSDGDAKNESGKETQTENEVGSSVAKKTGARSNRAGKSPKAEAAEDDATPKEKAKGKGRASAVQKKKNGEQEDPSGHNSTEQEADPKERELPQAVASGISRKRPSADSGSDPAPKSPRSSPNSPSAVGPSRTPRRSYKVLFTGLVDEVGEKVLCRLGGTLANEVADMNCLVTDKVRRTVKFLCAVAKGIPVVTTQWLEESGKAGTFLSPSKYLVKDSEQEKKFNFNLQESLSVANSQPLLQGYEIHVTKSVKPEPVCMKDIITSSGGRYLSRMPSSNQTNMLVISCEEDWALCARALACSIPVVSAEFILTGILQQKVDLETHRLSGPASTPGRGGKSRKKT